MFPAICSGCKQWLCGCSMYKMRRMFVLFVSDGPVCSLLTPLCQLHWLKIKITRKLIRGLLRPLRWHLKISLVQCISCFHATPQRPETTSVNRNFRFRGAPTVSVWSVWRFEGLSGRLEGLDFCVLWKLPSLLLMQCNQRRVITCLIGWLIQCEVGSASSHPIGRYVKVLYIPTPFVGCRLLRKITSPRENITKKMWKPERVWAFTPTMWELNTPAFFGASLQNCLIALKFSS